MQTQDFLMLVNSLEEPLSKSITNKEDSSFVVVGFEFE